MPPDPITALKNELLTNDIALENALFLLKEEKLFKKHHKLTGTLHPELILIFKTITPLMSNWWRSPGKSGEIRIFEYIDHLSKHYVFWHDHTGPKE